MSGERGTVRKIYDVGPTAITSNGNFDGSSTPTTQWASGILEPGAAPSLWLTNLSESVADNGRVGISIACSTLDIRVRITPQPSVVGYQHLRMLVVADNECDGTVPSLTDILGSSSTTTTSIATGQEMAFLQPAYFGRFNVLEDKNWYIYCSSTANSFTESYTHPLYHESHHDLKGHRVMWDTTDASTTGNARKGHIFMYFLFSTNVTAAGGLPAITTANPPAIHLATRIRYSDA